MEILLPGNLPDRGGPAQSQKQKIRLADV